MWRERLSGFYAVLDAPDLGLAEQLVAVDGAGATILQLRIKPPMPLTTFTLLSAARMARQVTKAVGALLIIDDRVDIALAVDADGVHLGQRDLTVSRARQVVERSGRRPRFLIGVSTHNDSEIRQAVDDGVDYLAFGPVFMTTTKRNPELARGLAELASAVVLAGDVAVVAIGGIAPEHAPDVARTGAAAACAIGSVNRSVNPGAAGRLIGAAWSLRGGTS